tara:strand:+ start:343 stop:507 length:165 start_codon:yes stop_codon:yes gene_type:complete
MAQTLVTLTYTVEVVKDDMTDEELITWIDENHIQGGLDVGLGDGAQIENIEMDI